MTTTIKKGDTISIKDNLMEELIRCGFKADKVKYFVKRFKCKTVQALDVYQDVDQEFDDITFKGTYEWYVTVELCCEIPLTACELVVNS